jgi:hypothetical protein
MATNYPGSLDTLANPLPTDKQNNPSHSAQHGNANDAIEAIEAYVGVAGSTVPGTITKRVADLEAGGGGGSGAVETIDPNEGLELVGTALGTKYNTQISDSVTSIAVGGAGALPASTWKLKTLVQVLDTILFPDVLPTYTIPTITCSSSITGIREIGESINPVITTIGTENDAGAYSSIMAVRGTTVINTNNAPTQNTVADIGAQFGYTDPNNPNRSYTSAYTDSNFVVPAGSTTWNGRGSYAAGLAKKNNKGVDDVRAAAVRSVDAKQAADAAFNSTTVSITGIHPYFWGKSATQPTAASIASAIAAGTANKQLSVSTGTVTVTYNAASEYIWVAIPATSTDKTKWYFTDLNQGAIGAGQLILAPVIQNVSSPQGHWTNVPFDIYISGYATTTSGAMEYRNS